VGLKLNETHQLFIHVDGMNLLSVNIDTINLIDASNEVGLEVSSLGSR
jgi:hypothetical protein